MVITDGGEEFTDSAKDVLRKNLEKNSCRLTLAAAESRRDVAEDARGSLGLRSAHPDASEGCCDDGALPAAGGDAEVVLERLTWGDHKGFLERYGGGGGADDGGREEVGFDFVVAADVICEWPQQSCVVVHRAASAHLSLVGWCVRSGFNCEHEGTFQPLYGMERMIAMELLNVGSYTPISNVRCALVHSLKN